VVYAEPSTYISHDRLTQPIVHAAASSTPLPLLGPAPRRGSSALFAHKLRTGHACRAACPRPSHVVCWARRRTHLHACSTAC
jgi:hypothetical protein